MASSILSLSSPTRLSTFQRRLRLHSERQNQQESSVDYLSVLPVAILHVICEDSDLDPSDLHAITITCRALREVSTQILYKSIVVCGRKARQLAMSIALPSITTSIYAPFIRSLNFTHLSGTDLALSMRPLSTALVKMKNLTDITFGVPSHLPHVVLNAIVDLTFILPSRFAKFLLSQITQKYTLLGPLFIVSTFVTLPPDQFASHSVSEIHLPTLRRVSVRGSHPPLFHSDVPISTVQITEPVGIEELKRIIEDYAALNSSVPIQRLQIALDLISEDQIIHALWIMGHAFCRLEELSLCCPRVNALLISSILAHQFCIFPNLYIFSLNRSQGLFPTFTPNEERCLQIQHRHIERAAHMRPLLNTISFGTLRWRKSDTGMWTYTRAKHWSSSLSDADDLSEFGEHRGTCRELVYKQRSSSVDFPPVTA